MEFLSQKQLNDFLPWSHNTIETMVKKGIFRPITSTGRGKKKGKRFYIKSQVEETLLDMTKEKSLGGNRGSK